MKKLSRIVDSLNIKFRTCSLSHPYFSFPQGLATHVVIPSKAAYKLIQGNPSLAEYLKAYPRKASAEEIWITKSSFTTQKGEQYVEYEGLPFGWSGQASIRLKRSAASDKMSGWIVNEDKSEAFYFQNLKAQELPVEYARLVQYVDCMIDTTAQIYFPQAKGDVFQQVTKDSKAHQFVSWAENFPHQPELLPYDKIEKLGAKSDSVYGAYRTQYRTWDSLRMIDLDQRISLSSYWRNLLAEAVDESANTGNSDGRLEFYAARYLTKEDALKLMRSRKVVGTCSMDQSPRYHAMNICKLSAETAKWDIFLRSHLDIMNDRFDRVSDGSYAWAGRKTYFKELEQLDIKAEDLLIGTCLRVENVSDNHYWGSIGRVGRALADVPGQDELEKRLLAMILDTHLDPYNRLLMVYLFDNYSYNLDDEGRKKINSEKLETAISELPEFIRAVWKKRRN